MTRSRLVDHATGHPMAAWVGEQLHSAGGGIYHIHSHAQNATPRTEVLKLFPGITPSHLSHIQQLLAHIQAYQDAQGRLLSMLPALPRSLVRIEGSTDVGVIMTAMPGDTIADLVGARRLPRYALPIRLRLAACLALDVQVAHDHHFVHGDINDHNLMIDPERIRRGQVRAHLIDFDGMGFTRHDGSVTHPRHKGRNIGSSWAPELYRTASTPPSIFTDRWSLAQMIHLLLFDRLDPFFQILRGPTRMTVAMAYQARLPWPQHQPTGDARADAYLHRHLRVWNQVTPEIRRYLRQVFDYQESGGYDPQMRPLPLLWNQILHQASLQIAA